MSGDDGNGIFEAGETWTFTKAADSDIFTYDVTQADFDSNGLSQTDPGLGYDEKAGSIDNAARLLLTTPPASSSPYRPRARLRQSRS